MGEFTQHNLRTEKAAGQSSGGYASAGIKTGSKQNTLAFWGNKQTMNLNHLVYENIMISPYYKNTLSQVVTYHEVLDEIYYNVDHLEPWERGTRKTTGQTGMCGGVRGVGAGGVVSSAFCILYKLFTLKLTRKQLISMLNHSDSCYIRGLGFMYVRYCLHPNSFWYWFEPYLDDEEEIDPKAGGGEVMTIGDMIRQMLNKLEWYTTLFPRIPVPIQKEIDSKLRERARTNFRNQMESSKATPDASSVRPAGGQGAQRFRPYDGQRWSEERRLSRSSPERIYSIPRGSPDVRRSDRSRSRSSISSNGRPSRHHHRHSSRSSSHRDRHHYRRDRSRSGDQKHRRKSDRSGCRSREMQYGRSSDREKDKRSSRSDNQWQRGGSSASTKNVLQDRQAMSEHDAANWCLIESDPAVFTEMIKGFGCSGVEVQEVYSLSDLTSKNMGEVYGLIFLFKWQPDTQGIPPPGTNGAGDVYFALQVVQNACASQALINLLLNCESRDVDIGSTLREFKTFTANMDPASRGLCLTNCDKIRSVHNSFSRPLLFELDSTGKREEHDAYHFITYVPKGGRVFELDGLAAEPVDLGAIPDGGDWLAVVHGAIAAKVEKYSSEEIRFNLMAIVPERKGALVKRMQEMIKDNDPALAEQVAALQQEIANEDKKLDRYKLENNRRRHNYVPFIVELIKVLAKEGKLTEMISEHIQTINKPTSTQQMN
ncbi:PRP38 family protein [Trichuris suis]|nr:PRP38 family protein [Trichuris suis]